MSDHYQSQDDRDAEEESLAQEIEQVHLKLLSYRFVQWNPVVTASFGFQVSTLTQLIRCWGSIYVLSYDEVRPCEWNPSCFLAE